jgi:GAF domain-containing protein
MRRRSRANSELAKARSRKAKTPRRRTTLAVRHSSSSASAQETEVMRLTRELNETHEQQTATSEVLEIIGHSTFDLQRVLESLLEKAVRLCGADRGFIFTQDGDGYRLAANYGHSAEFVEKIAKRYPITQDRGSASGRAILERRVVHIPDILADPEYRWAKDHHGEEEMHRTILAVPMLREDKIVGVIIIRRTRVEPFTEKQVALVSNFATQAVIAVENTRLLSELRQRTADLSEALEQQTATSEVLGVISSSPGELSPVFQAMLDSAVRICQAKYGQMFLYDGKDFRAVGTKDLPTAWADFLGHNNIAPHPAVPLGRALITKRVVHVNDARVDEGYVQRHSGMVAVVELGGARTLMVVPMLKENEVVGAIGIYRQQVRPFTDKQIALVQNFAAQAVIAIENARLLNELRQRTDDLTESLEQQTATSEVLKVISSSPGDLKPVFESMPENATRICGASFGSMLLREGDRLRRVAVHNAPPRFSEFHETMPVVDYRMTNVLTRIWTTKKAIHIADLQVEEPNDILAKYADARTVIAVPLLKNNELLGVFGIYRQEVRPFTNKQIELVKSFAAQAVIAIENTRLLSELRESLQQQTATADVLRVISSSPGKLEPIFGAILENATRICQAGFGALHLVEGNVYRTAATYNVPPAYAEVRQREPLVSMTGNTALARVARTKSAIQIVDAATDPAYRDDPQRQRFATLTGARSLISVPMLKDETLIGAITVYRLEVQSFTEKQIELVQNFSAQAVLAIENTRLLNELRQRTTDLTESLEQQTATSKVLEVISRSAFDLHAVFETVAESSVKLCGADRAMIFRFDGELLQMAVAFNAPQALKEFIEQNPIRPGRGSVTGRAVLERRTIHIPDVLADREYTYGSKDIEAIRTLLAVPILKGDDLLGVLGIYHLEEVRPFTDKQIALLETFADQAAIAIDNVRLLDALRHRTDELGRSVSELRALGEVSQAVNSTLDLETVLSTIVAKAVQLSGTEAGAIYGYDEQACEFRLRATYGMEQGLIDALTQRHIGLDDPNVVSALAQREPTQIADLRKEAPSELNDIIVRAGYRARMVAPLMRGEEIVGTLVVRRRTPGEFAKNTVDLIRTFAAQSALAIQNARLFHEIQDKSRQLEEASQHKSQFLANMSHELRPPLNAILGYTELMADGAYGEPSEKMLGILKRLEANGKHLLGLINDVLDLSKIEAGQLVLELSDYSIQDIAQTVRSTLEPLAADKKLGFKVEVAPQLPPGRGDGRRLTQVLINLVGNAIKFTDTGEIAIKAEAHNGLFHVSVRDTGPGISSADQVRLFQEFQQADNAITRRKGGTGLGLAISKRIIEMHGGRIWVESHPGQGSTFTFTLPVIVERQVEAA